MSELPAGITAVVTVPLLLSVATVGQILDLSDRTVRRRIADGSLPAVVDHGRVMVRADELRTYIDRLEHVGPARARRPKVAASNGRYDWLGTT